MYLRKIELHGFKSFAQKTEINYHPGITAIVGPNGCGKSNVIDAVRWVLGEQRAKALRSEKMDNVIFNGTQKRRPLGLAEVSLCIENNKSILPSEYNEIVITRRLYRNGESEYLMNGVSCRLRDITDLFMDTGMGSGAYSVIELKMIEEILSENVSERRRLFEEAAGITKYKIRRRQALQKLDTIQQDLSRVKDLTDELERQVRSLANQASKARRYKQFKERILEVEVQLAVREFMRLQTEIGQLETRQRDTDLLLEAQNAGLATHEAEIEVHRTYLIGLETRLADAQRLRAEHLDKIRKLEADLRIEKERQAQADKSRARLKHESVEADQRHSQLLAQAERIQEALTVHDVQTLALRESLAEAKSVQQAAQAAYEAALKQLEILRTTERQAAALLSSKRNDLNRLVNKTELLGQEERRLQDEKRQHQSTDADLQLRAQTAAEAVQNAKKTAETARIKLKEAEQTFDQTSHSLQEAQTQLRNIERETDALAAEIRLREGLAASYEEFSESVQFLAKRKDWTQQPPRTVSDLFACDPEYQLALDTALREVSACFVVASEEEARAAIGLLRAQGKGQSAFLILNRLPDLPVPPAATMGQSLRGLVRVLPRYERLADVLLHQTYLTETLDEAQNLAQQAEKAPLPLRFISKSGEWADSSGMVLGGSKRKASAASHRMGLHERLAQLRTAFAETDEARQAQMQSVRILRESLGQLPLQSLRDQLRSAERALAEAEKAAERVSVEAHVAVKRSQEIEKRLLGLQEETAETLQNRAALEAQVQTVLDQQRSAEAERQDAEQGFASIEAERRQTAQQFNDLNIKTVQAENHLQNLKNDLKRKQDDAEALRRRVGNRQMELELLDQSVAETAEKQTFFAEQLHLLYDEKNGLDEQVQRQEEDVLQSKAAISDEEAKIREVRRKRDDFQREVHQLAVKLAERQTKRETIQTNALENLEVNLVAWFATSDPQTGQPPSAIPLENRPQPAEESTAAGLEASENHQETADLPEPEQPRLLEIDLSLNFDETAARKEVLDLRQKMKSLGAVNELALEAYETEKQRLDFIVAQQNDLREAEKILLETIREINETATKRFNETFTEINRHFQNLFVGLFNPGDTAQLLMDDSDPLEAGIKIIAKPRGKQPSSIAQLSGGEKTLTAIALLFAIYLVKPSPFCILDEVDAPLDDANIERFMRLIRQFAENTQFILVTHNKLTMEAADRMYGITMQEAGVSKVVSVSFDANGQAA